MIWLSRITRVLRKARVKRPKEEKQHQPWARLEKAGWTALDTQMALEHWLRTNAMK